MKHSLWHSMLVSLAISSGCALSHGLPGDVDGGMPSSDAEPVEDAGGGDLAPPCEEPSPICVVLEGSVRELDDVSVSVDARDVALSSIVMIDSAAHVAVQVADPNTDQVTFLDRVFDESLFFVDEIGLDVTSIPAQGTSGATSPSGAVFVWGARVGLGREATLETRWLSVGADGVVSIPQVANRLDEADTDISDVIGPSAVSLGSRRLSVSAMPGQITVVDLEAAEVRAFSIDGTPALGVLARPLDDEQFAVMWHTVDDDGFANANVAIASFDGVIEGPVRALSGLSQRASLLVLEDEIWVAGFERTTLLADSRLRVAKLAISSLERTSLDASFFGWGGLSPAGFELVAWGGEPWLVWLTDDARYGSQIVLYAQPLPTVACGARVTAPALVSSAPVFGRSGSDLAVAVDPRTDGRLYVAHAIGSAGLFDLHALRRGCEL